MASGQAKPYYWNYDCVLPRTYGPEHMGPQTLERDEMVYCSRMYPQRILRMGQLVEHQLDPKACIHVKVVKGKAFLLTVSFVGNHIVC